MKILNALLAVPNLLIGFATAALGLLVLFGVDLSEAQIGGIVLFLGATMALAHAVVVPSGQVMARQRNGGEVKGTSASELVWGLPDGSAVKVDAA